MLSKKGCHLSQFHLDGLGLFLLFFLRGGWFSTLSLVPWMNLVEHSFFFPTMFQLCGFFWFFFFSSQPNFQFPEVFPSSQSAAVTSWAFRIFLKTLNPHSCVEAPLPSHNGLSGASLCCCCCCYCCSCLTSQALSVFCSWPHIDSWQTMRSLLCPLVASQIGRAWTFIWGQSIYSTPKTPKTTCFWLSDWVSKHKDPMMAQCTICSVSFSVESEATGVVSAHKKIFVPSRALLRRLVPLLPK